MSFAVWPVSAGFFFVGLADGAAGKLTYAIADSSEPIDPPLPSPLNAVTANPTFLPATCAGTASSARHEEPEHALSTGIRPPTPDCVLDTSYDCKSGSGPFLQVTNTFLAPRLPARTSVGTCAGLRRVNVLLA
ncbi:hypothetical protein AB0K18_33595 [Nonomuraea sp. NPDC049421]|uniref:hypothetical protein n=1 Tax=Nonomuraea sp. NPDC049421 TaxID=3155275 RepID=UPI003438770B